MIMISPIKLVKLRMMSNQTSHSGLIITPHLPSLRLRPLSYMYVHVCTWNSCSEGWSCAQL